MAGASGISYWRKKRADLLIQILQPNRCLACDGQLFRWQLAQLSGLVGVSGHDVRNDFSIELQIYFSCRAGIGRSLLLNRDVPKPQPDRAPIAPTDKNSARIDTLVTISQYKDDRVVGSCQCKEETVEYSVVQIWTDSCLFYFYYCVAAFKLSGRHGAPAWEQQQSIQRDEQVRDNMRLVQMAAENYAADHGGDAYPLRIDDSRSEPTFAGALRDKRRLQVGAINPFTGLNQFPSVGSIHRSGSHSQRTPL